MGGTITKISSGLALGNLGLSLLSNLLISPASPPAQPPALGPLRPPNWGNIPQTTIMQVQQQNPIGQPALNGQGLQTVNYYFDAVFDVEHEQRLTPTKHPVQTGAAISDHAYLEPSEVTLEIGMSDLLQSFVSDQYSGGHSKSVNAYQAFRAIQASKTPITLVTRLYTYSNMVITNIGTIDNVKTQYGLRARIHFSQIIPAVVSITTYNTLAPNNGAQPLSARPQDTNNTQLGTAQSGPVTQQEEDTFNVLNNPPQPSGYNVPGAGAWSSNPIP